MATTVGLFAYSAYSYSQMPIILIPDHPLTLKLRPYQDAEILLLPVDQLLANTTYFIRESHKGSDSFEIVIKRKLKESQNVEEEKSFDPKRFRKKYANQMGYKTLDYKQPS